MKLWVDYTNHRGERRWREIDLYAGWHIGMADYPPFDPRSHQPCILVKLVDREERRTLALASCHEFRYLPDDATPASSVKDKVIEAVRADLLARSVVGIQKYGTTLAGDTKTTLRGKLQHAYEEALDLCNYLQWTMQHLDRDLLGDAAARAARDMMKPPSGRSGHDRYL